MWRKFSDFWAPKYPSPYSTAPQLQLELDKTDDWDKLTKDNDNVRVVTVDLSEEPYGNKFKHKYSVKLDTHISPDCNMTILFPTHPIEKKRRLCIVRWKHAALQKEINARLNESHKTKNLWCLGVTCRGIIYRFQGMQGNLYLLWAERVNQQTINNQINPIREEVPLIVEMDGSGMYQSVFLFPPTDNDPSIDIRMPHVNAADCTFLEPYRAGLFCMETDTREDTIPQILVHSGSEADKITKEEVNRDLLSVENEQIPFPSDADE